MLKALPFFVLFSVLISSCGRETVDNTEPFKAGEGTSSTSIKGKERPVLNKELATSQEDLQGKWSTGCVNDPNGTHDTSMSAEIVITGTSFQTTLTIHQIKLNCENSDFDYSVKMEGSFVLGRQLENEERAVEIDFNTSKIEMALLSDKWIEKANKSKTCELSTWKKEEFQDITRTTCANDNWMSKTPYMAVYVSGEKLRFAERGISKGVTGGDKPQHRFVLFEDEKTQFPFVKAK